MFDYHLKPREKIRDQMNYDYTLNWTSRRFILFNFLLWGLLMLSCMNIGYYTGQVCASTLGATFDIYENPFDQFSFALAALI